MIARLKAEKILRELNYNFSTFSINGFLQFVGKARGCSIITIPWTMPNSLFGVWISDREDAKEYIFYRDDLSKIHQTHIQLHELAHFLFRHPTLDINKKMLANIAIGKTALPFDSVAKLRSPSETPSEIEAETLADLIQQRIIRNSRTNQLLNDISPEVKLANFLEIMS